ncbi:uroporphyrinogen-III synthase [Xylophilus rhododendri]|uniref:uroporphyrinogen-III synthase n=1 Tax=Xylophilus rhododendri TaxID=2697032 RepID=UPI001E441E9D|nr:uroporphyrinogen-III synthase [Xylophilus rhododendri]
MTRPAAECESWSGLLRQAGFDAVALPLIAIHPLAEPGRAALLQAWAGLGSWRAVMFVSAAAVQHFFDAAPEGSAWPAGTRAWAPGPGTAAVLLARGVAAADIDQPPPDAPRLDSEALWQAAGHRIAPGDGALIVRGAEQGQDDPARAGHGRAWMAERLCSAGALVSTIAAYSRAAPAWTATQAAEAARLASPDSAWVFSNSEAVTHLFALLPQAAAALRLGGAIATHPRIAAAARAAGFARVIAASPGRDGLIEALHTLERSIESAG